MSGPEDLDRMARDLVHSYARAVDRSDWALLMSLYHSDAVIDHGLYQGDPTGFVDFVRGRRVGIVHTAHYVSNVLTERVGPDAVAVECYGWASQTHAPPSPTVPEGAAGIRVTAQYRCVDLVTRRSGRWAFAEAHLLRGTVDTEVLRELPEAPSGGLSGVPAPQDPMFGLLQRWRSG